MNTAERSPVTQADAARSGSDSPHSQSKGPLLDTASLDASEADRYALAFRPSWAPLLHEPQPTAAATATAGHKPQSLHESREEPLALPGRKTRRRGRLLAGASVLSFVGLVYWGISSSTPAVSPAHVARLQPKAGPSVEPPTPPAPAASPEVNAAPPPAPAADLSALAARPEAAADPLPASAEPPAEGTETATSPASSDAPEPTAVAVAEPAPAEAAPADTEHPAAAAPQPSAAAPAPAPAIAAAPPPKAAIPTAPAPAPSQPLAAAPPAKPAAPSIPAPAPRPAAAPAAKPAAAPLAAAPAQPAAIASAQATHAPAPEPAHKHMPLLSVRALPEGARLFLDGQRLPNPFDMRLPEGGKHKLEARFEGYETSSQTVRIESDAKLTITLKPEPQLQVRPLSQQQQHTRGAGFVTSNPY